jgi:drug/metabolite transporter (DMT)-like permease
VMFATGGKPGWQVARRAVMPGVLFALAMLTSFASFQQTSIANATLIPALLPALVLLVAPRLFGERVTNTMVAFAAIAFAGTATVVVGAGGTGGASFEGDLLAVANLVVWTTYFLMTKRARAAGIHAGTWLFTVMVMSAFIVTPWAFLASDDLRAIGGDDWWLLGLMVVVPGLLGHGLMTWAQQRLDITVAALLQLATPVVAAVGAYLVHHQPLRPLQIVGAATVIVGLAGIVREQTRASTLT